MLCDSCGSENASMNRLCAYCGLRLPTRAAPARGAAAATWNIAGQIVWRCLFAALWALALRALVLSAYVLSAHVF